MTLALVEARPYNNASQHRTARLPNACWADICRFLAGDPAVNERPLLTFSKKNTSVIVLTLTHRDISALSQVSRNLQSVVAKYLLGPYKPAHTLLIARLTDNIDLLSRGLDLNLLSATNHGGNNIAHLAVIHDCPAILNAISRNELLRPLLEAANQKGNNIFHLSAIYNRSKIFSLILNHERLKSLFFSTNRNGLNAYQLAWRHNSSEICDLIKQNKGLQSLFSSSNNIPAHYSSIGMLAWLED